MACHLKRRIVMKKIVVSALVWAFLFGTGLCLAESTIPNLVGTWDVKSEAGTLFRGTTPGAWTHHTAPRSALTAVAVFTKQEGRILHGTFTSPRATENFVAVIGLDNKTLYYADHDGFLDGTLISNDKIQSIYRHVTQSDTVVALGTWTRRK
jgi:hypothetical protein